VANRTGRDKSKNTSRAARKKSMAYGKSSEVDSDIFNWKIFTCGVDWNYGIQRRVRPLAMRGFLF
jgi:hypothetical protein